MSTERTSSSSLARNLLPPLLPDLHRPSRGSRQRGAVRRRARTAGARSLILTTRDWAEGTAQGRTSLPIEPTIPSPSLRPVLAAQRRKNDASFSSSPSTAGALTSCSPPAPVRKLGGACASSFSLLAGAHRSSHAGGDRCRYAPTASSASEHGLSGIFSSTDFANGNLKVDLAHARPVPVPRNSHSPVTVNHHPFEARAHVVRVRESNRQGGRPWVGSEVVISVALS
ncbi:hypothetical protein FKP32DRAFT_1187648 [Trametes sanguinea]|nr:hypothetical protein FKP32DRAFT_1187648 [Trametes sanguinea]